MEPLGTGTTSKNRWNSIHNSSGPDSIHSCLGLLISEFSHSTGSAPRNFRVQGCFRAWGLGFRVSGDLGGGCKVSGLGFRDLGFRVFGVGFKALNPVAKSMLQVP